MEGYREQERQLVEALERLQAVERRAPGTESQAFRDYVLLGQSCLENWTAATVASPIELNAWIRCRLDLIQAIGRASPVLHRNTLGPVGQVYREAHELAVDFRRDDSSLTRIPEAAIDPVLGLHSLRAWCADAQVTTAPEMASASPSTDRAVDRANKAMRSELESNPYARNFTAKEWAAKIGVSQSTISVTATWSALMDDTGRGRKDRPRKKRRQPKERCLTDKLLKSRRDKRQPDLNDIDVGDRVIAKLLAEQRADDVEAEAIRSGE